MEILFFRVLLTYAVHFLLKADGNARLKMPGLPVSTSAVTHIRTEYCTPC